MIVKVPLGDVLSMKLLEEHADHIRDFLLQEGVTPDPNDLAQTVVTERQVKELMAELASDIGR